MGELFEITYERFIDEIEKTGVLGGGRNPIEVEEKGEMLIFYVTLPDINKTYTTVIAKDKITDVQKLNLMPKSKPARRITEDSDLKNISESLVRIEENLRKTPEVKK